MKTCEEWSLAFDRLYDNITSNQAPGLNEYEKSCFLSDAEVSVVVALYNGTLGESFESTEGITAYLDTLVKQATVQPAEQNPPYKISENSVVFKNPSDLLFRTWEGCKLTHPVCGELSALVVPVTQDEYWRTSRDPFKNPNKTRVLRLSYSTNSGSDYSQSSYSELVSDYPVSAYTVRYISKPKPIILEDLSDRQLSIDGYDTQMTCTLPEVLHQTILAEAVRMAKATWNA